MGSFGFALRMTKEELAWDPSGFALRMTRNFQDDRNKTAVEAAVLKPFKEKGFSSTSTRNLS